MNKQALALFFSGFFIISNAHAFNAEAKPAITYTSINQQAFKEAWGISDQELDKYQRYMQTTGRYFYSHLDPLMVLGMIEKNTQKRERFAERYLLKSRERITQETTFADEIGYAQKRLFPGEKPFDFSKVAGYDKHRAKRDALKAAMNYANSANTDPKPIMQTTASQFNWKDTKNILSIDYWIPKNCQNCTKTVRQLLQQTPDSVVINLYAKENAIDELEQIITQVSELISPARVIAPKLHDPVIWNAIDKPHQPVVRRNGVIVARL